MMFCFHYLFIYPLLYSTIFTSFYHIFISYPIHTSSIYNKRLRSPRLLSPLKLSYSYCITAFRLPSYIYTAFRHDSVLLPECPAINFLRSLSPNINTFVLYSPETNFSVPIASVARNASCILSSD